MGRDTGELSIKGESIQSLYNSYLSKAFLVNRRYQRKLVWTIEEKRSFIDSIVTGYPVPLILLARQKSKLEIIDGMQRMNAIMSYIEQEYDVDGKYFDLDSLADTKYLKDDGFLVQKEPVLSREKCANIARYPIPLSIFEESGESHIDEVFRRLNSGGKHLSKQELRQAGTTSLFANLVRRMSASIRGDTTASDILDLSLMKLISITNKHLDYGIHVDDIFWVKNGILTREGLRESKDEEIIADIVSWVSFNKAQRSSSEVLNQLYGYDESASTDGSSNLAQEIDIQIQKNNEDVIENNIGIVFDVIREVVKSSGKTLLSLLFERKKAGIARYFIIVFLAFYEVVVEQGLDVQNFEELVSVLDRAGDDVIHLSAGGGNWSAKEKQTQIAAFVGVIQNCFFKSDMEDPARDRWITKFENILMQSSTEQVMYDFKIGLHTFSQGGDFNKKCLSKVVKTLTAMVNSHPKSIGYCIIGVADKKGDAEKYVEFYGSEFIRYSNFYVTGHCCPVKNRWYPRISA